MVFAVAIIMLLIMGASAGIAIAFYREWLRNRK